jgi:TolB protein
MDRSALGAVGAVLAVAIHGSSDGVRNGGIVWGSYDAIRSANVDGSGRRVLVPTFADNEGDPSWRDGRVLAFFASFSDTSWIYAFRPRTHKFRRLRSAASRSFEPPWSPDGKRIAVSEDWGAFGARNQATIKIVLVATNKWRSVTKPRCHRIDSDPAWSPDGQTIAFARQGRGPQGIYLARPDGSATRRLTMGRSPSWSPDGKSIAYALRGSIYRIRAAGRARERILSGLRNPLVRWSPDGRKLLYTTGDVFHADAWIADVDGTHRRRVLHHQAIEGIAWRPGSG